MNPMDTWKYGGGDACCDFFTAMMRAHPIDVPATAHVLEIGCAEFDWLSAARASWPDMTLTGIDWRGRKRPLAGATVIKGDVMRHEQPANSLDWIVSVSAIEHIGLGHYEKDPTAEDGDVQTLARVWDWLKPGGWVTFDVPWNVGSAYEVVGTSHRVYDDRAVETRLAQGRPWVRAWTGCAWMKASKILVDNPEPQKGGEKFYYRGFQWQKPV